MSDQPTPSPAAMDLARKVLDYQRAEDIAVEIDRLLYQRNEILLQALNRCHHFILQLVDLPALLGEVDLALHPPRRQ